MNEIEEDPILLIREAVTDGLNRINERDDWDDELPWYSVETIVSCIPDFFRQPLMPAPSKVKPTSVRGVL